MHKSSHSELYHLFSTSADCDREILYGADLVRKRALEVGLFHPRYEVLAGHLLVLYESLRHRHYKEQDWGHFVPLGEAIDSYHDEGYAAGLQTRVATLRSMCPFFSLDGVVRARTIEDAHKVVGDYRALHMVLGAAGHMVQAPEGYTLEPQSHTRPFAPLRQRAA